MKDLMKSLNSRYGNKGIIFTLDMAIAVIVFVLLLSLSSYYISQSQALRDVDLKTIRTGADVLAYLDHDDILHTMNINTIETNMDNVLPDLYNMRIEINCEDSSGTSSGSIQTTDPIPDDKFVGSGKRVFVREDDNYCLAKYFIWLK